MIETIFYAPLSEGTQTAIESIDVHKGAGIVGDRNYGRGDWPGQNITFIEAEEIERFNREFKQSLPLDATRRNCKGLHPPRRAARRCAL